MKAETSRMTLAAVLAAALAGCGSQAVSWGRWNEAGLTADPVTGSPTSRPIDADAGPDALADGPFAEVQESQTDSVDPRLESYVRRLERLGETDRQTDPASQASVDAPTIPEPRPTGLTGELAPDLPAVTGPEPAAAQTRPAEAEPAWVQPSEIPDPAVVPADPTGDASPADLQPERPAPAPAAEVADADVEPPTVEILEVRAVLPASPSGEGSAAAAAVNQASLPGAAAGPADLPSLIEHRKQTMARQPPRLDDEFNLRLLQIADNRDEEATAEPQGLDPVQAELMTRVLRVVADARRAIRNPTEATAAALGAAQDLCRALGQQAGVIMPKIALVTRVDSFGVYEPIQPLRFPAGKPVHAYVYTEVTNFRCEPTPDGRLRTLMSETVEVFDAAGKCLWQRSQPQLEDHSRSPRRDFFIGFPIHLPADLPVGEYVLKVTLEDRIGGTADQQRLSFSIARP